MHISGLKHFGMENHILELEKKYWEGMENHDYPSVASLTRFPCIVAGKDGVRTVDEATFKKMFESGKGVKWKVLAIDDVQTQTLGNNALIGYLVGLEATMDGKSSSMRCACTSTWIKENEEWRCAMHTESDLKE